jgi:hypothetical protein
MFFSEVAGYQNKMVYKENRHGLLGIWSSGPDGAQNKYWSNFDMWSASLLPV